MGSSYTDTTKHKLTGEKERGGKKTEKERRGGKITPEVEYNTGKEKRGWMEAEGKRQWGKVQNGSNTFAPLLCSVFFPVDNPSHLILFPSVTHLF